VQIDKLVGAYHKPVGGEMRLDILFHLYVATNFWLKKVNQPLNLDGQLRNGNQRVRFKGREERTGAITELRDLCAEYLAAILQLMPGETLDDKLVEEFGLSVSDGVKATDLAAERLGMPYLRQEAERRRYKLSFRNGLAYRWVYRVGNQEKICLTLYDTVAFNETGGRPGERDVGLFVMGTNGRIYTGLDKTEYRYGYRHSCFFAGEPVFAAGMLGVSMGRVVTLSGSSGHYGPKASHMLAVLSRLAMYGVDLSRVTMRRVNERNGADYGIEECPARAFLRARGWPTGPERQRMWVDKEQH
jgi:hypothetical protein